MVETKKVESGKEDPEALYSTLLAKGRITVWIILVGSFIAAIVGTLTGDQLLDVLMFIGPLWLGGELGARKS